MEWNPDAEAALTWQSRMRNDMDAMDARHGLRRGYGEDDGMWALRQEVAGLKADYATLLAKFDAFAAMLAKQQG